MSNTIANHVFVCGRRADVNHFFAEFLSAGLNAHVPIPPDAEPSEDPAKNCRSSYEQVRVDHWGTSWADQDVYWKYEGVNGVAFQPKEWSDKGRTTKPDQFQLDRLALFDPATCLLSDSVGLPGFRRPSQDDVVAYFKFYSPWKGPDRWFGRVANAFFPKLRFFMQSFDIINMPGQYPEFWSVDGPGDYYQNGHWAAWFRQADIDDDDADDRAAVNAAAATETLETTETVRQSEGEHNEAR
jgi:hypothetical protein